MDERSSVGVIALVAAIVGWYVVHRLAVAREREKFRREAVAKEALEICTLTSAILDKSITYHCGDRDEILERELKSLFDRLSLRIQHLPTVRDAIRNVPATSAAIMFKQAVTGIHFEDEHEGLLAPSDAIVAGIQIAAYKLEEELLGIRATAFNS